MPLLSSIPLVGRLVDAITGASSIPAARRLKSAPVHAVETRPEKRPRTLKHLLRGNHVNHALMYGDDNGRHNHMAHALCSAYLLGATPEQMNLIYDAIAPKLVPWQASPAEIADVDWRDYLGDTAYQRAYVDFFEDVLAEHSVAYNWRTVVEAYLLGQGRPWGDDDTVEVDGDLVPPMFSSRVTPTAPADGATGAAGAARTNTLPDKADRHLLLNSLICGLGHPLIHLAYAYEMDSRVLAMEALGMTAVTYNADYAKKYPFGQLPADDDVPDALRGLSLQQLVDRIAKDARFDAVALGSRIESLILAPPSPEVATALLEYWHAWDLTGRDEPVQNDLTLRVREAQDVSADMLVASVVPGTHSYNFFVCHALTTSHAVRVLLPEIPPALHVGVLQQWWLLALATYVAVGRPPVDPDNVPKDHRKTKGWTYVEQQAVSSRWSTDEHYIKNAARTWGDIQDRYLNAAVWFADDFEGWVR
ncbi:uncharacterized protein SPSK_00785 [Sporothrix schenckii 1099-18]|uniref:MGS207 protein n=1 Tax=Sporothrix schenckii 1099-18 TaxID=1397361 RepID=A0A0F2LYX0_SPOSC|nr:uncharacterized protein SPSK_00785 [Sporothrix schenckii 1099-18]KJR81700.1 hypothetical protein SPSK_00785 [Sporothrix schenckii 1099-18]